MKRPHAFRLFFLPLLFMTPFQAPGATLHRGNGGEVDSLHIHKAQGLNGQNILRDVCEGLFTANAAGRPSAGVAESWHTSADRLTWTFNLRSNARWSDGTRVRAEDFVRAWQQALQPATQAVQAPLFDIITGAKNIRLGQAPPDSLGVTVLSSNQLQLRLTQPDTTLPERLSLPLFCPLHPNESNNARRLNIANGAYRISQWVPQEKVVLEKNPYFHAADTVFFSHVVYWVTEDPASELKRFRAGELDITETIPDNQIEWIRRHLPDNLRIHPYLGTFFLGLNTRHPPLDNTDLREALMWAIDRNILTEKVLKSGQLPAYRLIPPPMLNEQHPQLGTKRPFVDWETQLAHARKKLAASGFDPANAKPLEILYNTSANQRKVALAVAAMWRQNLGIRARLRHVEWKVFVNERTSSDRQVFRSGWIADINDPLDFLRLFRSDSPHNYYHYDNPDYDALLSRIERSTDPQRQTLVHAAEQVMLQTVPIIPLYFYVSRHLVSARIGGWRDNVSDRHLSRYLYEKKHTT